MKVNLFDLSQQNASLRTGLLERLATVLDSGKYILGPEVERFEHEAREFLGGAHAIACSSGSDALVLALVALGVGQGDEVITTPFSFFATVESIVRLGACPRFVDLAPGTFAMDPARVEEAIGPNTRAILAVHVFGNPSGIVDLQRIAAAKRVPLVEDAAQAFGARVGKRSAGTFGALGCFSFQPVKPLGALGDAGMVITEDSDLARRCQRYRIHGAERKHHHASFGGNYRMDALQAAVLSEKLPHLPDWLTARALRASKYEEALAGLDGLILPEVEAGTASSWAMYSVRVREGRRDDLARHLAIAGVETAVHYPLPLYRQPALRERGLCLAAEPLPEAERASTEVLSLPLSPELSLVQLDYVVENVRSFFGAG